MRKRLAIAKLSGTGKDGRVGTDTNKTTLWGQNTKGKESDSSPSSLWTLLQLGYNKSRYTHSQTV